MDRYSFIARGAAASGWAANAPRHLNRPRVAQISDTQPLTLNSNPLGIGRHVSGIADTFNGHIDEFRIAQVQRSDG